MNKKALITGITGQDGSYLAEFLLDKGYEVHGIVRRSSLANTGRIDHLLEKNAVKLHDGDLSDSSSIIRIVGDPKTIKKYNNTKLLRIFINDLARSAFFFEVILHLRRQHIHILVLLRPHMVRNPGIAALVQDLILTVIGSFIYI